MLQRMQEFKGCLIHVSRKSREDDWYITVQFRDGTYGYDGWWRDSHLKNDDEAIAEAKRGALLEDY